MENILESNIHDVPKIQGRLRLLCFKFQSRCLKLRLIYAILLFSGSNSCLITRKHKTRIATDTFFSEFCNNRLIDCNHTTKSHQKLTPTADAQTFMTPNILVNVTGHHCLQIQDKYHHGQFSYQG